MGSGTDRDHTPTPREYELPNGDLVTATSKRTPFRGMRPTDVVTVPADKRPLYELLLEILVDVWVPDLMPARIACECENLVDARDTLEDIERGSVAIHGMGYGMGYCFRARDAIVSYRDRDPLTLVAVGCSGSKHDVDEPMSAKSLYKGGYWTNKREFFEAFCDDGGRIISAEHDLLHPDAEIEYYEKTVGDLRGIPVDHDGRLPNGDDVRTLLDVWAYNVHNGLSRWLEDAAGGVDPQDVQLEILLGKEYEKPLKDRSVFEALRIPGELAVSFPFRDRVDYSDGGGIGKQRSWMAGEVESAQSVATDGGCKVQSETDRDYIYVGRAAGTWKWSTDYDLISEWAGGEDNVSIMHKRGREYVLDLSQHPDAIENQWCSHNRRYECGHVAYGPPRILPSKCPECHPVATDGGIDREAAHDTDRTVLYALAAHAVGDFPLQSNRLAATKFDSRVARGIHVAIYTAAFAPVVLASRWTSRQSGVFLATIAATHFAIDTRRWTESVPGWNDAVAIWYDQALHIIALAMAFALADRAVDTEADRDV